jgi:hypothetical protein
MCCGRNPKASQYFSPQRVQAPAPANTELQSGSRFQYLGKTGLTVVGPTTGARYRFDQPGSQLRVDPRDCPAFLRIPVLKPVA